jgi:hypothetical protein
MEKKYKIQFGVGKSKYVVNHYDGQKQHKDGSAFFDIAIFKNMKDKDNFVKELRSKGYKREYKDGGGVGENKIDFKNFTIAEFNSFVKSINAYGDIDVSVSEGNNVNKEGTYTKRIDLKKLKDLSMSIGDSGKEISVVTGSENIYADVLVYDNNYDKGYKEYTISLFSKDDKKGLKSVVNSIIEKFKKGGGIYSSDDTWVVTFQNQDSAEFEKVSVRANNKKNAIASAEDESGLGSDWEYYSAEKQMAQGGSVKVGDKVMLPEIKMRDGKMQFEKVENGEVLSIENGIYDVLNPKTNRIHRVTLNQIKYKNGGGVGFRNIDKIKSNIGETVFNHINSLNKSQLEKQLSELKSELKSESKNTERHNKLKDEEWYILYRLERSSEFKYRKGGATEGKSNYKKFGKDNSRLVNFDIDDLDSFESFQYDQLSNSMDKADALQILINNTESDYSQLNEQLAEIAEEQYPSDEFFEDNRQYKKGGGVGDERNNSWKVTFFDRYDAVFFDVEVMAEDEDDAIKKAVEKNNLYVGEGGNVDAVNVVKLAKKSKYADGGATKGFEYSIGGL